MAASTRSAAIARRSCARPARPPCSRTRRRGWSSRAHAAGNRALRRGHAVTQAVGRALDCAGRRRPRHPGPSRRERRAHAAARGGGAGAGARDAGVGRRARGPVLYSCSTRAGARPALRPKWPLVQEPRSRRIARGGCALMPRLRADAAAKSLRLPRRRLYDCAARISWTFLGGALLMLEKLMPRSDEFFDDFDSPGAGLGRRRAPLPRAARRLQRRARAGGRHQGRRAPRRRHRPRRLRAAARAVHHPLRPGGDPPTPLAHRRCARPDRRGRRPAHALRRHEVLPPARGARRRPVAAAQAVHTAVRLLRDVKSPEELLDACREIRRWRMRPTSVCARAVAKLFKDGTTR